MGVVEVIEVVVAAVSVSGIIVGAEGEEHWLGRRDGVWRLPVEELRSICSERSRHGSQEWGSSGGLSSPLGGMVRGGVNVVN